MFQIPSTSMAIIAVVASGDAVLGEMPAKEMRVARSLPPMAEKFSVVPGYALFDKNSKGEDLNSMKRTKQLFLTALTLAALSAGAWAQTSASTTPAPKKKHKPVAAAPAAPAVTAADVQALKDALAAQQQQIQQLTQQLQQNQQSWQQAQAAASDAANKAAAAQAQASQQQQTVVELKGDVTDLKTNVNNTALSLQETQKTVNTAIESPAALHYKGVTITPGGYAAAEFIRRSRGLAEDVATPLNSLTLPGASQNSLSEFFGTGRTSRMSALVEGQLKNAKLSGYVEADFLSAGVTSTNNSTNSYTLRQRQAFGQAAFNSGWTFTGGQQWSLVTENGHGLDNRSEAVPLTIDTAYNAGMTYARQYGLRLTKNLDNKVWFGISVENSQATVTTHSNASNFLVGEAGSGKAYNNAITTCATTTSTSATGVVSATTTCTPAASYSFNPSPDIIAKLAFEPGFGHYEVFGLFSRFRDRVYPCEDIATTALCGGSTVAGPNALGANDISRNGGGIGANARWTVDNKHIVFGLHGFGGSGIGRYGTSGLPDASVYANGSLHLVRTFQGLGTLEWHGKKLDIYSNAGVEYAARTADYDPFLKKEIGYGAPLFSNTGCYTETDPATATGFNPGSLGSCTGDTRADIEGTLGFWYRFYNGPKGRFQYGMQFSYATRQTWSGVGPSGAGNPGVTPEGLDGMVFTSFRYYLP